MSECKLDIGCGPNKGEGYMGLDIYPYPGVDVVFDVDSQQPWPFDDNSFDIIRINHLIEHINHPLYFLQEVHRIGRADCRVHIETPHFSSSNSWRDPTHVRHYSAFFLDVAIGGYFSNRMPLFDVTNRSLYFSSIFSWPGMLMAKLSLRWYEKHWAWIFPASTVIIDATISKTPE
jgi:SAM-dependent methyltransferase